jgi:hypothetical protein
MKIRNLLLIAVLVVTTILVFAAPVSACTEGCTPGFWKQPHHFEYWVGYSPTDTFSDAFGVGPDMSLLDALSAKRQDFRSGDEAALVRHAVAALLNAAYGMDAWTVDRVIEKVRQAWDDPFWTEAYHREFEGAQNLYPCPFDD